MAWLPVVSMLFAMPMAGQTTYTFSNANGNAHNTWDSGNNWATALSKPITVSGVPTTGMVLRQVRLDLGSASGSNISTLTGRLTDPAGNTVDLFAPGYFFNTDFSRFVNITFRDHPVLKRLNDYSNSFLGMPYSFGYYRVEQPNSYSNFNTTDQVNGTWTFSMIEGTATEIQFNAVELVFGPPFQYTDITGANANNACAGAQCLQSGNGDIVLATNVSYPQGQPNYPPLTVNGCNWNAEPNNTAWFYFIPSASTVNISVSGFTNNAQQTIVLRNNGTCTAPSYSMVGCPTSMFVSGCNTTTGDPLRYHRVCYDGGTKFNHGYTLTGLTVGQEYVLIVDGQSGANSTFYVEIASGADNGCLVEEDPVITDLQVQAPDCDGLGGSITVVATGEQPLEYSIDGGNTFQSSGVFTGLSGGVYEVVVRDPGGNTDTATVELVTPPTPAITALDIVAPTCGGTDGVISITASSGGPLLFSADGGVTFQAGATFQGLAAGSYTVVVATGSCAVDSTVVLNAASAPVIEAVNTQQVRCFGEASGVVTVVASGGTPPLQYSINGGDSFQGDPEFTGLVAGTYAVVVQDAVGCASSIGVTLTEPEQVRILSVEVSAESCAGSCDGAIEVLATGTTTYAINDGDPQGTGVFSGLCPGEVLVSAANANGCTADSVVVVEPGTLIQAGFTASPTVVLDADTPVVFTNTSVGASIYLWDFAGLGTSFEASPTFTFGLDAGTAEVCLTVESFNGCVDSTCVILSFGRPPSTVEVPNVFSPNGDGNNDTFSLIGDPGPVRNFSLQVFNRWGQLIFDGTRVAEAWDGRQGSGEQLSEGTYFWVLRYTPEQDTAVERTGHVTLLR